MSLAFAALVRAESVNLGIGRKSKGTSLKSFWRLVICTLSLVTLTACAPSGGGTDSNDLNSILRNKSSQIRSIAYFNGGYPLENGEFEWRYDAVIRFDDSHLGARTEDEFCFKSTRLSDAQLQHLGRLISGLNIVTYDKVPLIYGGSEVVKVTFMDRSEVEFELASLGMPMSQNVAVNGDELSLHLRALIDNSPLLCQSN